MDYSEARNNAKALCGKCYVCDNCNGIACKGQIPGMGGKGSGRSFIRNFDMLTHVKLNMDVLCDNKPIDTSFDFLGYHMALPVFIAPMAGIPALKSTDFFCSLSSAFESPVPTAPMATSIDKISVGAEPSFKSRIISKKLSVSMESILFSDLSSMSPENEEQLRTLADRLSAE